MDKCFCHLNGYAVKDATARNRIEEVNNTLNEKIDNIPEVDLSNHYTKSEVLGITGELENLNTTDKSNLVNAINEALSSGGSGGEVSTENYTIFTEYDGDGLYAYKVEYMTPVLEALKSGKTAIIITKNNATNQVSSYGSDIYVSPDVSTIDFNTYSGSIYFKTPKQYKVLDNNFNQNKIQNTPCFKQFSIVLKNGVLDSIGTISEQTDSMSGSDIPVLSKSNRVSYTPTSDYHPATKKYVDDAISGVSGGGSTDLSNYYTKDEVDTSLTGKVDTSTYNTKVSEIESSITALTSKSHTIYSGTTEPTSDIGVNGDIYVMYSE